MAHCHGQCSGSRPCVGDNRWFRLCCQDFTGIEKLSLEAAGVIKLWDAKVLDQSNVSRNEIKGWGKIFQRKNRIFLSGYHTVLVSSGEHNTISQTRRLKRLWGNEFLTILEAGFKIKVLIDSVPGETWCPELLRTSFLLYMDVAFPLCVHKEGKSEHSGA